MLRLLTVLLILGTTTLFADSPLTITDNGYYLTVVDSSGIPALSQIEVVVDLRTGTTPIPPTFSPPEIEPAPPIRPPVVPVLDLARVEEVRKLTPANDPMTAQAIAFVYAQVAVALHNDRFPSNQVWDKVRVATEQTLLVIEGEQDWSFFRGKMSSIITEAVQRGTLNDRESITKFLWSSQRGIESAIGDVVAIEMPLQAAIALTVLDVIERKE